MTAVLPSTTDLSPVTTGRRTASGLVPDPDWWREAVVYQVYPRSFADGDGDGIGDLPGLRSRLPYLAGLGVDAVWLSPFYPSPLADGGYDVVDHRDVDPRLGTLEDVDGLVADAHALGVRVIVDVVPNHTSDRHPWFVEALASPRGSAARGRYVFRDGIGPDGAQPPSDWRSHFGGSAWEPVGDGQWYLHLFAKEQPDLDWSNPQVREDFLTTLRFWADRGVDGFRVDVAHALAKDLCEPLRSQPHLDQRLPLDGSDPLYDREEVHEIYRSWRRVLDEYDPPRMAVGETWTPTNERTYLYSRPDELGQVFDFSLLKAQWGARSFRDVITRSLAAQAAVGGGQTWVLSSHDVPRHATRYALPAGTDLDAWLVGDGSSAPLDPDVAARRARAATVLMLALPGSAYLYQGEELGLLEVADLPAHRLQDPVYERTGHALKGRDGCRVPIPWTADGPAFGFGASEPWLPQPGWFAGFAAQVQEGRPESSLELYRRAIARRRDLARADGVSWVEEDDPQVLHLARGDWHCVVSFSDRPHEVDGELLLTSDRAGEDGVRTARGFVLAPETAAWYRRG